MATKKCSFCRAETQENQGTRLFFVTFCESCGLATRVGLYISGFLFISAYLISIFHLLTPGSTVANIWAVGTLLPLFVLVPIYLLVARLRNFTTGWSSKPQELERQLTWGCLACIPLLILTPLLSAAAVFLYQCYLWLRNGEWVTMPVTVLFEKVLHPDNALLRWFTSPESWLGVHKLISGMPLTVALLLLGVALIALPLGTELGDYMWAKKQEKASKQEKT